ncbi:MAG: ribosomal L7Ae/L30e/S12e/Gadd45 family protein [Veillonella sp.]|nr:ribosomal L7Ae/L30e/S12e/Gadd45 family protein [Veillonella sp.]
MKISHLKDTDKTIGAKQTLKAIRRGDVSYVFIGSDSDGWVSEPIISLCEELCIPYDVAHDMEALGRACHIKVKAAAVGVLR